MTTLQTATLAGLECGCAAWLVSCLFKENPGPSHSSTPRSTLPASHRRLPLIISAMSIMHVFKSPANGRRSNGTDHVLFFFLVNLQKSYNQSHLRICEIKQSKKVGGALMTDEERTNRLCSQMKCKELHGQKLSFTAPHFKCCFLFPSTGMCMLFLAHF